MSSPRQPAQSATDLATSSPGEPTSFYGADEPPVVARVMVEIRSDGSRTIARGAMEDLVTGQRVAIEAKGTSLINVALQLAGSMRNLPSMIARTNQERGELAANAGPPRIRKRDVLRQKAMDLVNKIK